MRHEDIPSVLLASQKVVFPSARAAKKVDRGIKLSSDISMGIIGYFGGIANNEKQQDLSFPAKYISDGMMDLSQNYGIDYVGKIIDSYKTLNYIVNTSIKDSDSIVLSKSSVDALLSLPVDIMTTRELANNLGVKYHKNIRSSNSMVKLYQIIMDIKDEINTVRMSEMVKKIAPPNKELLEIGFSGRLNVPVYPGIKITNNYAN